MAEPIIGRRTELQALARFVEAVPAGGRALLIEGDAGIGKTALLYEGVRTARACGFRVLTARAAPAEAQMAFTTIGDLFARRRLTTASRRSLPFNGARSRSRCCCASRTGRRPRCA